MKKLIFTFLASPLLCLALTISPDEAVIILPEKSDGIKQYAAVELQEHLKLLTGKKIPISGKAESGQYPFLIGLTPDCDKVPLNPEEGRFLVSDKGTFIYGMDRAGSGKYYPKFSPEAVFEYRARTGTLFAVYEFLEKQFGFRWLEPGERGIVFHASPEITFKEKSGSWAPGQLAMRHIRPGTPSDWKSYSANIVPLLPAKLRLSEKEYEKKRFDERLWLKRQRMGRHLDIRYGHAFTNWKERFLKSHPEYFAVDDNGKIFSTNSRYPGHFQLCVSNPAVHRRIIDDYRKSPGDTLNVCENDGGRFCRCPRCRSWDADLPGEKPETSLTDRYLKFANTMQKLLVKENPNASAVMYIYEKYRFPPRREKVDPRLILGFVPELMELPKVDKMYRQWREAGAKRLFFRPNDLCFNTGLPMGFEKQIFENFKLGIEHGIIGTDISSLHNFWPATGIADYIIARGHVHPEKSFEELEEEYASAYGAAAPEVKKYFRYWRNEVWEKRLLPNRKAILERGRFGNYRRGVVWDLRKYYKPADFDATDAILKAGAAKKLSDAERARLEVLRLANEHLRLFHAVVAAPDADTKLAAARKLLSFRIANRDKLSFDWGKMIQIEKLFGDTAGTDIAVNFAQYSSARSLPMKWRFKMDPRNVGIKEKWPMLPQSEINRTWDPISLYAGWEHQPASIVPAELREKLKNYDGIGFYAVGVKIDPAWKGKKIYLFFGAVDESAWVYVNGTLCGERIYRSGSDDWKTPFAIDISRGVNPETQWQSIVVRVEDKGGQGGIRKPVFVAVK